MQDFYSQLVLLKCAFMVLPLFLLAFTAYFIIFTPQEKQRLATKVILNNITVGAIITTHSNVQGTIIQLSHNSVIIELASGEKIEIHKQAIKSVS